MENSLFLRITDDTLKSLYTKLDLLGLDQLDISLSDGKLQVEFEDGTIYIVNRQLASQQLWLAEPKGGWRFDYKDELWICDKLETDIFETIIKLIGQKLSF
ncbi:MAG: iron donor protein CyaY [Blastocatellia bacterium]|nr:iron donor protein CyaY [Blastocatellia bacterium]